MISIIAGLLTNKWVAGGLAAAGIFIAIWTMAFYKGRASIDIPAIERAAYAKGQVARDGEWQVKLKAAEAEADRRVAEIQSNADAAEEASPTPTTAPELVKLCEGDPLCRK